MKTRFQLVALLGLVAICFNYSSAHVEDYGYSRYYQPNGVSFIGHHFADEHAHYYQAEDDYFFVRNSTDGYYYYVRLDAQGNILPSLFKVKIDDPVKNGVVRYPFLSPDWIARINRNRGVKYNTFKSRTTSQILSLPNYLQVILVEFSDVKNNGYKASDFTKMLFSEGTYTGTSPDGETVYGSMRDYYLDMSGGNLALQGRIMNRITNDVPQWIALSNGKHYYHRDVVPPSAFYDTVIAAFHSQQPEKADSLIEDQAHRVVIIYAGNRYVDSTLNPREVSGGPQYV